MCLPCNLPGVLPNLHFLPSSVVCTVHPAAHSPEHPLRAKGSLPGSGVTAKPEQPTQNHKTRYVTHRLRWALCPKWSQRVYNRTQLLTALRPACPRTLIFGWCHHGHKLGRPSCPPLFLTSSPSLGWESLNSQSRWAVSSPPRTIFSPFLLGIPHVMVVESFHTDASA